MWMNKMRWEIVRRPNNCRQLDVELGAELKRPEREGQNIEAHATGRGRWRRQVVERACEIETINFLSHKGR